MEKNILKEIFFDNHQHWESFKNRIRPVVIKEVEKFRKMDLNSLFVKAAMMFEKFLIVVKPAFVQHVHLGKVKNGAVY